MGQDGRLRRRRQRNQKAVRPVANNSLPKLRMVYNWCNNWNCANVCVCPADCWSSVLCGCEWTIVTPSTMWTWVKLMTLPMYEMNRMGSRTLRNGRNMSFT